MGAGRAGGTARRRRTWPAAVLVAWALAAAAAGPARAASPPARLAVQWRAGKLDALLQLGHVPGGMGAYGSGAQLSLRQLSWGAVAAGLGLAAIGQTSNDASYTAMGAMLGPLGLWGLYTTRDTFTFVTGEYLGDQYGVRHYAEDLRYIHDNYPKRRDEAVGLARRHPDLHAQFLWSLEAFRDPATESPEDRAFRQWCRALEAE